ncbi:MAG: sensor domain-containing diguanylate cyclase [Synechococcaceae cyanobacterium]|nr:sensor domain-containing diguanylate cyclase [Synechococcaceae cyanobacterium]
MTSSACENATLRARDTEAEQLLTLFIDQAPVAIAMFDRGMRYVAASRRWISDFGLEGRPLRGQSHYDLFPEIPNRWRQLHQRGLQGEVISDDNDCFQRANGSLQWLRWEIRPWYRQQRQGGILIFSEDISERKQAEIKLLRLNQELEQIVSDRTAQLEQTIADLHLSLQDADRLRQELHEQSIHDPLTGLYNRRFLEEALTHELARARRLQTHLSVMMLDLDSFKQLNDVHGHLFGDTILRSTGATILRTIRGSDIACRYGGDEFAIVLPSTDLRRARLLADHLRHSLNGAMPQLVGAEQPRIRFSFGVSALNGRGMTEEELLRSADQALYDAKHSGGDQVRWDPGACEA